MGNGAVRLGIVGLGRMGFRHAQNAVAAKRIKLIAVADVDAAHASQAAVQLGAAVYQGHEVETMLRTEHLDGLIIATPAGTHAQLIELAAAHGVGVFCEKPLADDGPAAVRALKVADEAGITVQVGFQMRFDRDFAAVADLIEAGSLGTLYQMRASLRDAAPPSREYLASSGGYFWDGAIHLFDLARWFMGDVTELTAFGAALSDPMFSELGDVDNTMVVLRFTSGALGFIETSRVAGYGFESGIEVLGSDRTARVPGGRVNGLEVLSPGLIGLSHATGFLERFEPAYPRDLEAFVDALRGGDAPRVTGQVGLAAMRLAAAAVRSLREGRTVRVDPETIGW
jgi:myo-inositol 2-dehydrogenase/D-chiro-inositol 1-dehydrogenase